MSAASQGQAFAQSFLGSLYNRGWGVPMDPRAAQSWWLRAAHAGVVNAMFNMGVTMMVGRGAPRDPVLASALMQSAKMRGMRNPRMLRTIMMSSNRLNAEQKSASNRLANKFAADPAAIPAL